MIQIDMPMPKSCVECRFSQVGYMYCHAMPENFCGYVNYCEEDGKPEWCPLKAQETKIERIATDYGLTVDGVSFALDQYQTIISEITHGLLSKLSYRANDVLQVAQERWCETCEIVKAHEPRVMAVDEVEKLVMTKRIDRDPIFVEICGGFCACIVSDEYFDLPECNLSSDLYGRTWRCWTSRPDEKRRAETPWN